MGERAESTGFSHSYGYDSVSPMDIKSFRPITLQNTFLSSVPPHHIHNCSWKILTLKIPQPSDCLLSSELNLCARACFPKLKLPACLVTRMHTTIHLEISHTGLSAWGYRQVLNYPCHEFQESWAGFYDLIRSLYVSTSPSAMKKKKEKKD